MLGATVKHTRIPKNHHKPYGNITFLNIMIKLPTNFKCMVLGMQCCFLSIVSAIISFELSVQTMETISNSYFCSSPLLLQSILLYYLLLKKFHQYQFIIIIKKTKISFHKALNLHINLLIAAQKRQHVNERF